MILGIYGSGGAGKEVKDIAASLSKWEELIFIDDNYEAGVFKGIKRITFEQFKKEYPNNAAKIIIAIGEPKIKKNVYDKVKAAGYKLENVIHSTAIISPTAVLGEGITVHAGAVINPDASIGDNVAIFEYAVIGHDARIGCHCQISGFSILGGHVEIGEGTYIGMSACIKQCLTVGRMALIGMASAVMKDVDDNIITIGNPARAVGKTDEHTNIFACNR